jgi:AraC-like DNA-binding protein
MELLIEAYEMNPKTVRHGLALNSTLLIAIGDTIALSYARYGEVFIKPGYMAFLPAGTLYTVRTQLSARLLVVLMEEPLRFCDCLRAEDLRALHTQGETRLLVTLKPSLRITALITFLLECMDAGCRCKCFIDAKIHEMLALMRWEYNPKELAAFFAPAFSTDAAFSTFVLRNYQSYHTLGELAEAMNYTVSGLEKRFKRVFGTSPYRWMLKRKAENVYHELYAGDKPFGQLSFDYGFNSVPHFISFVKANLGATPSEIRNYGRKRRKSITNG